MVGVHAALVAVVAAFGLYFLSDPCGGGGDLCLGGYVGLVSLVYAGIGVGSVVTWRLGRRASPLLVWDSILITLAGAALWGSSGQGAAPVMLGVLAALILGVPGAILAGREVAAHRIERVLAILALAASSLLALGAIAVTVTVTTVGLIAMVIGWFLARSSRAVADVPAAAGGDAAT